MFAPVRALLLFLLVAMSLPAWAEEPDCSHPQIAADSLFIFQRPGRTDLAKASACFDLPDGKSGEKLAVQLKTILDARNLWVPVSTMSDDPDYVNARGQARSIPMPDEAPWLVLVRDPETQDWQYSVSTLEQVPTLYKETFSPFSLWLQDQLPSFFQFRLLGIFLWQYLYGLLLALAAWLGGQVAFQVSRTWVKRAVERLELEFDHKLYAATNRPLSLAVIVAILIWGIPDIGLGIRLQTVLLTLCWIVMGMALAALSLRVLDVIANLSQKWSAKTESKLDDQLIPLLRQATRTLILFLGLIFVLDAAGIDVWKLAAGVGIGGLAFALAAQDTVANLFGSVNIFVDKPFQIGDWVKIGGDIEGVVEEVGFRSTRVRTFYNSLVTVPNSNITNAKIDNLGLRPRRRIKMTLSLTYNTPADKVQAFVEGVRAILAAHPYVQRTYEVHFYNFGGSALEVLVYYHVIVPGWHEELETRSQNLMEIMRLAEDLGVSFAFPSTSVYLESTPDNPLQRQETPPREDLDHVAKSFGPNGSRSRPDGPGLHDWSVQARTERSFADEAEADGV